MTKLALKVLAQNETPGGWYGKPCPCGCGGVVGVETTRRKKHRDGRGWVVRFLKCKACGWLPENGQNKWVTVDYGTSGQ